MNTLISQDICLCYENETKAYQPNYYPTLERQKVFYYMARQQEMQHDLSVQTIIVTYRNKIKC